MVDVDIVMKRLDLCIMCQKVKRFYKKFSDIKNVHLQTLCRIISVDERDVRLIGSSFVECRYVPIVISLVLGVIAQEIRTTGWIQNKIRSHFYVRAPGY